MTREILNRLIDAVGPLVRADRKVRLSSSLRGRPSENTSIPSARKSADRTAPHYGALSEKRSGKRGPHDLCAVPEVSETRSQASARGAAVVTPDGTRPATVADARLRCPRLHLGLACSGIVRGEQGRRLTSPTTGRFDARRPTSAMRCRTASSAHEAALHLNRCAIPLRAFQWEEGTPATAIGAGGQRDWSTATA